MTHGQEIVLVVDDDLAVRESLKFALELEGLTVRVCGSGEELLNHPDLPAARCILLDYKMPVMDGLEVLEQLAARKTPVPVILITSRATNAILRRAKAAGVRRILEKPLLDGALLDNIQAVLGGADPL
ncbi:response regulator transcription factor [Methyloferula stellata]|uniref:response regulator transcription factor n=1 Tax=Methyloferula stellata TaxID=876270 RepID=UPI0003784673|nr:response regulator [Methyloferula stellata]